MAATSRPGSSARAFRALLALYPAAFRDEYGREMALVFADRYCAAASSAERARVWLEVLAGVLTEAPKEHVRMTLHDLRYGFRRLRLSPGFALIALATLALAIGVSTAMFSVLNAVLLRPLPYADPERLAAISTEMPSQGLRGGRMGYATVEQWRRESRSFASLAVSDGVSMTLTRGGESEQVMAARVSPNLFPLLGITPARGRFFTEREAAERQRLAVISYRFWQTHLGGAADAVGRPLELDGATSLIVGILPSSVAHTLGADIFEPHTLFADWERRRAIAGAGGWFVVGRLRDGVSMAQARTEMNDVARRLDPLLPVGQRNRTIGVVPLDHQLTGAETRLVLWMLTLATLLLLVVAAANVAGLSLARSVGRVPEMAIRAALGASRARLVRMLLAESVTLAVAAGVLGVTVASASVGLIRALGPAGLARLQEISVDGRVLAWALFLSLGSGLAVGVLPALTIWRRDLRSASAAGGRGVAGGVATRLRRGLVVAECAVAIVLLGGAGLLVRSWWNVLAVDAGFQSQQVLALALATPPGMEPGRRAGFFEDVLRQVSAVPGVGHAGISSELFVGNVGAQALTVEGGDPNRTAPMPIRRDEIAGGFFQTLGTRLLRGRHFTPADGPGAPRVAIVNDVMARRIWPGRDPIGRRFAFVAPGTDADWFTVVGVVGDMRRQGPESEPVAQVFESQAQNPSRRVILFVRASAGDPVALAAPLRAAVRRADDKAFVYGVSTVEAQLGARLAQRRLQTTLLAVFAAVALLLATIGIYGLIQYSVAARTHEIGIRMALGAGAGDIFRMIVREGLTLTAIGLGLGLVGAWWLARAGSSLLFGVTAADPLTLAAISLTLALVAAVASALPARRAMRVAPVEALQQRVL